MTAASVVWGGISLKKKFMSVWYIISVLPFCSHSKTKLKRLFNILNIMFSLWIQEEILHWLLFPSTLPTMCPWPCVLSSAGSSWRSSTAARTVTRSSSRRTATGPPWGPRRRCSRSPPRPTTTGWMVSGAPAAQDCTVSQSPFLKTTCHPARCVPDTGLPNGAAQILLIRQEGGGHRPDAGQLLRGWRTGAFVAAAGSSSSAAAASSASSCQESLSLHVAHLAAGHQQRVRSVVEMRVYNVGIAPFSAAILIQTDKYEAVSCVRMN